MIQHSCVGLIAQELSQHRALCAPGSSRELLLSAHSALCPPKCRRAKRQHCGVTEVSVPQGVGCPRTDPSSSAGMLSKSPGEQDGYRRLSPDCHKWPLVGLCPGKGADFGCTMEQDVPFLTALPRNCSFDMICPELRNQVCPTEIPVTTDFLPRLVFQSIASME